MSYISNKLREQVIQRANACCEYCRIPANIGFFPHEIDHIIAEKHDGATELENLAYACWRCNRYKGSDLGSFDPITDEFTFLYHPRNQHWSEHFSLEEDRIVGETPVGRTTEKLLQFNTPERQRERRLYLPQA